MGELLEASSAGVSTPFSQERTSACRFYGSEGSGILVQEPAVCKRGRKVQGDELKWRWRSMTERQKGELFPGTSGERDRP
jgi:hypothetical protein